MSIGTTIKTLRRGRDLTQEELAEVLGVSAKAVSQWENDRTAPDLSQIPAICTYFDISADTLLGIDTAQRRKVRDELFSAAQKLAQTGHHREAAEAFSTALARFPDDFEIMNFLNYSEFVCISQGLYPAEEARERREDCIRRNERTLAACTDDRLRYPAIASLATCYAEDGDKARAEGMIARLPDMAEARNFVMPTILSGDERIRAEQWLLFDVLHYIRRRMMWNLKNDDDRDFYSREEMAEKHRKVLALFDLFYEDGDIGFFHNDVQDAHLHLAVYEAENGNMDKALDHLRLAAESALAFTDYCRGEPYVHTSLLFRGLDNRGDQVSRNTPDTNVQEVLHVMAQGVFDGIRRTPAFEDITRRLTVSADGQ
ncbi:MAG: helix-turn-helix transcriptional regulator [Ruminococcaceae bacterium]|nr:helix-turn-helix transcriptional regulator [Oscillospiraceae bacterium]